MIQSFPLQIRLMEILRMQTPKNVSLAHRLSQILNVSADGAYRRIRGETALTLDEAVLVCRHFEVPLEALNELISHIVSFRYHPSGKDEEGFFKFIQYFVQQLLTIRGFENRRIVYAAEDIPLFHLYGFNGLTAFKFFYWRKTILNHEPLQDQRFEFPQQTDEAMALARKAYELYAEVESTEIWTEETTASTLKQIAFYWEAGLFSSQEDALKLLEELDQMILRVQRQCDLGLKFRPEGNLSSVPFTCYVSDLMIGNNCVLVETNGKKTTFLGYNTFHFMSTGSVDFNAQNEQWIQNLMTKSTQISRTAEKTRNQFFKYVLQKNNRLRQQIEGGLTQISR